MLKDLRHAVRVLLHAKGWTAVVLVSLALGIGANTAVFSAMNGLLIKQVPARDPDGLVRLRWGGQNDAVTNSSDYGFSGTGPDGLRVRATFSYPMYQQFRADNKTLTDLFACAPAGRVNVVVDGQAEIASAFIATGNYYEVLGVTARLGRPIVPDDDRPDAPAVAVISSRYWHSRFMTDPNVLNRTIRVNDVPVTIVGVLEADFTGVQRAVSQPPDLEFPLSLDPRINPRAGKRLSDATAWWLQVMGRLRPGATPAQVHGNLAGVFQQTARAGLESYLDALPEAERSLADNRSRSHIPQLLVDSGSRGVYNVNTTELRSATILAVVVALVLLIVCANVANLLLSRATVRQRELAVRLSLGATRGRLVRQLLTESLLLAAAGGALGLVVGYWGKQLLPGPPGQASYMDWQVFVFVLAVTVVTGVVFGIAPALRATGGDASAALKQTSRSVAGTRSLLGRSLLVVQVALSLVLLVGAGLFLRTLYNLRHVDVGFNPENLLLFRVAPELNRYDEKRSAALIDQLLERIGTVPGVRSVALTNPALLSGSVNSTSIFVRGRSYAGNTRDRRDSINRLVVSPGFFDTLGIPIVRGRGFTAADTESSPRVVLINEAAARQYFPGEDPIGQRFGSSVETSGQQEIVGIVRDAKYDSVREPAPPTMYNAYRQRPGGGGILAVRTAVDPATVTSAVREAVRQVDPNLPMMDVSTQLEQIERRFQQEKMFAQAYTLFGALALLLAAIGLFGLMSYNVSRRTNEIGIRMALGAQRGDVLRLVMRESMILVALGVVIGVAVALWASRFVTTQLFGLPGTDAWTIAAAVGVMILASVPAGFLPARRASGVDPMVALRYD
jgi:predicted permease